MEIHLIFTKNNKLKFSILNNQYRHGDFKVCFSLVYSIKEIDRNVVNVSITMPAVLVLFILLIRTYSRWRIISIKARQHVLSYEFSKIFPL